MTQDAIRLISFDLCPFVQRSAITLFEKGIPFERVDVDLAQKPDWFTDISPFGKVPVLQMGERVLFESAVINEYLDEITPGTLQPTDPFERASHRAWAEFASALISDGYRAQMTDDKEGATKAFDAAREKLERLDRMIEGPYFAGETFHLVDAAFTPGLQRLVWLAKLYPPFDALKDLPNVQAWAKVTMGREAVKNSLKEGIERRFQEYTQGHISESTTQDPGFVGREMTPVF